MKRVNILTIWICLIMLLGSTQMVFGQTLATSGSWSKTTVSTQTVNLTGNVTMTGTVTIPNGVTLTIKGGDKTITTCTVDVTKSYTTKPDSLAFVIQAGGTLVMEDVIITGGNPESSKVGNAYGGGAEGAVGAGSDFTKLGTAIVVYDNGKLTLKSVRAKNLGNRGHASFIYAVDADSKAESETQYGPAIITLNNVTVDNCISKNDNGVIYTGGAYMSSQINLTDCFITNCMVKANDTGTGYGGVIKGAGSTDCQLTMKNCTMSYCWGSGWGGAILWAASAPTAKATFINCNFNNNYARYLGGAISTEAVIELKGCTIFKNTAGFGGGGLAAFPFTLTGQTSDIPNVGLILGEGNTITENRTLFVTNKGGRNVTASCNKKDDETQTIEIENEKGFNPRYTLLNATDVWYPSGGGGIYILMNKDGWNANMDFSQSNNNISKNSSASEGGGIYLYKQKPYRSATVDDNEYVEFQEKVVFLTDYSVPTGTATRSGQTSMKLAANISNNKAAFSGGGAAVGADNNNSTTWTFPSVTVKSGEIKENEATNGNGGGIYMPGGNFTIEGGTIKENKALGGTTSSEVGNGGGIAITEGTFQVSSNDFAILKNQASRYGGGLYVFKSTNNVTFSGGTLKNNVALAGGGVSLEGENSREVSLTMNANVESNTAINGGGVYLNNHASMVFTGGLLRNNTAGDANTASLEQKTAYQKRVSEVSGVGGGVFLDNNTKLTFNVNSNLGLYGNRAMNAADDIFANGNGTEVILPNVSSMVLTGFPVPAGTLYWAEDYYSRYGNNGFEHDSKYDKGTNLLGSVSEPNGNLRYQYALQQLKRTHIAKINDVTSFNTSHSKSYICMTLGYFVYYVAIKKKGLKDGESAIFTISTNKQNVPDPYITMLISNVPGVVKDGDWIVKRVALPEGTWTVKEQTGWSWSYTTSTNSVTKEIGNDNVLFEFSNEKKSTEILHDEDIIINKMGNQ